MNHNFSPIETLEKTDKALDEFCFENKIELPETIREFHLKYSGYKHMKELNPNSYYELNLFEYSTSFQSPYYQWQIEFEEIEGVIWYQCGKRIYDGVEYGLWINLEGEISDEMTSRIHPDINTFIDCN